MKPCFFFGVAGVGAFDFPAFCRETFGEFFFHGLLFRPAFLVGGESQVAVGEEVNGFIFVGVCFLGFHKSARQKSTFGCIKNC
jgi:hypothetical protein